jgi:microcystin-dependent protein
MAETQTPNFKWTKPDIGGDATVWGNVLNQTIDAVDAVAWATLNAGVPIGTVTMYAGFTPPPNWLWCDGSVYLDTDVPSLVAPLNHAWPGSDSTHTAVPNLWSGRTPVGYDGAGWAMGASGGEVNHTLSWSEMPSHGHGVSDPTHAHSAYQNAHNHGIATGGHTHNIVTGNHSHGSVITGLQGGLPGGPIAGGAGGNLISGRTDTAGNLGGYTDNPGNLGGNTDTQQPGVGVYASPTYISIAGAGADATHNNMQPYTVIGFIIRYK